MKRNHLFFGAKLLLLFLAVYVFATILAVAIDIPVAARGDVEEFTAYLNKGIPDIMNEYGVDAAAVGVIHNGKLIHLSGYGYSDKEHRTPVTPDTVFQVASVSKAMTAWGVMHLVEQKLVELDKPVITYLKRWTFPSSNFDASKVTVRRLLSHTAGVANVGNGYAGFGPDEEVQTLVESLLSAKDANGESTRLVSDPGTVHSYSGAGYSILQLMIEDVTGQPFADYMQNEVFSPLGFEYTSFCPEKELLERMPIVRGLDERIYPPRLFAAQAAAGLYTTAADMAAWVLASIKLTRKDSTNDVLSHAVFNEMLIPQPGADELLANGLGYDIAKKLFSDEIEVFHSGKCLPGWIALIAFLPQRGDGLVILSNAPGGMVLEHKIHSEWMIWETGNAATLGLRLQKAVNIVKKTLPIGAFGPL